MDLEIEKEIAEAFFEMRPEKRGRIQEKIPLKILSRLRKRIYEQYRASRVEIELE